jgi:L-alanine-DL-glutamate epimerase-like enolase superfamily enzyme
VNIDGEGFAHPPEIPGTGFEPDWDLIDNSTVEAF